MAEWSALRLEWLESFIGVIDHEGFHAASEALHRSQSRVSAHVIALEGELGAVLFDRSQRPVTLTAAGRLFEPHARGVNAELVRARSAVSAIAERVSGEVALGTFPSAGSSFVPRLLGDFRRRHGDVTVRLFEGGVAVIDAALRDGSVALALRPQLPAPSYPWRDSVALWREPLCLVVPTEHSLAAHDVVPIQVLHGGQLIVTGSDRRAPTEATVLLGGHGVDVEVLQLTDQPQTLVGLVRDGLGIGLTNQLALSTVGLAGTVSVATSPVLWREVALVRSWRAQSSPAVDELWNAIVAAERPPTTEPVDDSSTDCAREPASLP